MLSVASLSFAAPWFLVGLVALPALWWLLRAIPPAPRQVPFPAIRLLFGLEPREETPHRTPWWLLLLRLVIAAAIIIAFAHPLKDAEAPLPGSGSDTRRPLVLVIDNGWAAARDWPARQAMVQTLLDQAAQDGGPVIILPTAPAAGRGVTPTPPMPAAEAASLLRAREPQPWPVDRAAAADAFASLSFDTPPTTIWLSDGLASPSEDDTADETDRNFMDSLLAAGPLRVVVPPADALPPVIAAAENAADALVIRLLRPGTGTPERVALAATAEDGRLLASGEASFDALGQAAQLRLELPSELRNRVTRIAAATHTTAASVLLVDERFRRRPVGIVTGDTAQVKQPFLGDSYYLTRALEPYAELREGNVEALLERELAVLVLADIGTLTASEQSAVEQWIADGGVLIRFAGPRLAEGSDNLLPVTLRRGGRIFGGVMSWDQPATLSPFEADSPFAGLQMSDEIVVRRQVLAEPSPELSGRTWARLNDGTPLVTAERRGDGLLVLFHTTANAEWSSLALSGTYVDMLRVVVGLSQGVVGGAAATQSLRPYRVLDGYGRLIAPGPDHRPINAGALDEGAVRVGPVTPPGLYGSDASRRAVNLGPHIGQPQALTEWAPGAEIVEYGPLRQIDLRPWLLTVALILFLADFLISLVLRGILPGRRLARTAAQAAIPALLVSATLLASGGPAGAQSSDRFALEATSSTRLAYVLTGDTKLDETSRAGLVGLGIVLETRTSVVPGAPIGLDLERDELAFFSLLYWPVTEDQDTLSDTARQRVNTFLRTGGSILFDTRDRHLAGLGGSSPGVQALRGIVDGLDIPPLIPVPPDHVLTKSFYLLQDFPGRWEGGPLWVETPDERVNDGVSSVIIGSNDYASAWAADAAGRPMFPVVPGGDRQRELAFRFGVNIVMYALTGNYKADQVHVDAILERLGQ